MKTEFYALVADGDFLLGMQGHQAKSRGFFLPWKWEQYIFPKWR